MTLRVQCLSLQYLSRQAMMAHFRIIKNGLRTAIGIERRDGIAMTVNSTRYQTLHLYEHLA